MLLLHCSNELFRNWITYIYIHIADAPQGKRIDRSCAWKILCDSISVCAGEEESNPCMFPCPVSWDHVRAPARLTPAIGCENLITIPEYFNVRQHIFMLHDFSHVTPPELGSSYEVMLLEAFFFSVCSRSRRNGFHHRLGCVRCKTYRGSAGLCDHYGPQLVSLMLILLRNR